MDCSSNKIYKGMKSNLNALKKKSNLFFTEVYEYYEILCREI